MRLGFDLDGVLADFNSAFIDHIIATTGKDLFPPRPFDIPTWHYPQTYRYTEEDMQRAWALIKQSELFWERLLPYVWTHDVLERLHTARMTGQDIYFITDRPGICAKLQTEHWLHWLGYDDATVLISGRKDLCAAALHLDAYIDDRPENCEAVSRLAQTPQVYLLDRPWNRDIGHLQLPHVKRVETPFQLLYDFSLA